MKLTTKIVAGVFSVGLLVSAVAQNAQAPVKFELPQVGANAAAPEAAPAAGPAAPAVAAPAPKFTEGQLMEVYGYVLAMRMGLSELEFSADNIEAIARGMHMAAEGKAPSVDAQAVGPQLDAFLGSKQQAFMTKLRAANMAATANFLTKLKENKNVIELPSGLRYEVIKPGTGAAPKAGQVVKIHYTGSFINGQVFDSSLQPRQQGAPVEPAELLLQQPNEKDPRGVIAGMFEGLQKLNVGAKAKLYIPPHLAYGDDAGQGIPPGSTLIFEVEVLDAKDAPKEAAAPAPAAK